MWLYERGGVKKYVKMFFSGSKRQNWHLSVGKTGFLLFSLLLGHVYRDGPVGNRARDSMLLIFSHSARCPEVNEYIANSSNFCPVLAAGLSGLYRKRFYRKLNGRPILNRKFCYHFQLSDHVQKVKLLYISLIVRLGFTSIGYATKTHLGKKKIVIVNSIEWPNLRQNL